MRIQSKICGLSTIETLDAAIAHGASHVGLVHFPKSPRHLDLEAMAALRQRVPSRVAAVLLLVDPDSDLLAEALMRVRPDVVQLHGHETVANVVAMQARHPGVAWWKALPVRTQADLAFAAAWAGVADRILYDAKPPEGADLPGGNGLRFDWSLLIGHRHPLSWVLSGGLDSGNVAAAVRMTGAEIVDVSSGVESAPGIKDVDRIAAFLKAAST
jgi:phosphoribosylanthranilate isomerase